MVEAYPALTLFWFFLEKASFLLLNRFAFPSWLGSLATSWVKSNICVLERVCWGGSVGELFVGHGVPCHCLVLMFTVGGREESTRWAKINLCSVWFHPPSTLSCFSPGLLDEKGEQLAGERLGNKKIHQFWKNISLSATLYSVRLWGRT